MSQGTEVSSLIAMADRLRAKPGQVGLRLELVAACGDRQWLSNVPPGTESCMAILRDSDAKSRAMPCTMGISSMEAPSALATFYRWWSKSVIAMGDPGLPDPRQPLKPGVVLWLFDGVNASPAVDPPSPAGAAAIASHFAGLPWEPPSLMLEAAAPLGAISVEDLLAALVHPPQMPKGRWDRLPGLWERYLQAWCCLGLLHHQPEQPWRSSIRRQTLIELAYGVEDWITEAALYALIAAAWADPAARSDVAELVETRFLLLREAARTRPQTIGGSMARLVCLTPAMPGKTLRLAEQWSGSASTPPPTPPKRPSLLDRLSRRAPGAGGR